MAKIEFEWNPAKAKANLKKHGVAFEEAATVFFDDRAVEFYDDSHSDLEDRMLLIGLDSRLRLLLVCHCYRETDSVIRIISARQATKNESKLYCR
ncbi:BrnT family toxin [Planctomycetota bacterium]